MPISSTNVITQGSTTITNAITGSSTAPFPITLNTNDPQATSSVSSLQNDISVTLIPIISKLIDTPDREKAQDVIDKLDKVKPEAKNLLDRIDPDSKGSTDSCSGGGNPLSDLIKAVTCIEDGLNKVKSEVEEGIDNEFSDIKGLEETTTEMTELTEESDSEDDQSSSSSSSSTSSSSESCTSTTTEDVYVKCSAASAPGRKRQAATSCTTSTRTVTGCDISAFTTTTSLSCSETETVTNCDVVCPTTAVASSRLAGRASAPASCSTTCSTETGCSTTGATTTAWTTATTTATSTSSGDLEQCGTGCASCASISTPTATSASKRDLDLTKRTLTKPQDAPYNGDTGAFLVDQYVWAEWVPLGTGGRSNPTALYHELKNERYDMAVQGLYGCTSVVVVSEKAVYMSHFWEVPGFSQGDWGIGSQQRFEEEVLNPLENGDGGSAIPGLRQYAGNNGAFSSQYRPAAYIIKPGSSGRPDYDKAYEKKVDQIVEKVKNILGVSTPPIPITYTRVGGNDYLIPQGKVLFQYDPVESRQATDSCPIQQAMERLWVENKPRYVHQRYWVAYDDQKVQSGNQKRDCPADATPGGQVPLPSGYESESGSAPSGTPSSSKSSSPPSLTPTPSKPLASSTPKPTESSTSSDTTTSTEQSTTSDQATTTADSTTTEDPTTTEEPVTTSEEPPTTTEEPATTTEEAPTTTEEPPPPTTTTAAPEPTAQLAIAYVVNGMSNYWSVFQPEIGGALQWCGSSGKFDASGDISLKNVPYPSGDNDLDFEVDGMEDCVYSSESDETAGTLSCPDLAEDVECTEIEDQSQEDCYGVLNAKMVVPKVYCAWA